MCLRQCEKLFGIHGLIQTSQMGTVVCWEQLFAEVTNTNVQCCVSTIIVAQKGLATHKQSYALCSSPPF